eukprot:COSAG06_NODE_38466_length_423_cov_0.922840_2_plen_36_part_01
MKEKASNDLPRQAWDKHNTSKEAEASAFLVFLPSSR